MKNLTTLYIVRHGQTEFNVRGIMQGHNDSPLTEEGKLQAQALAKEFKTIHFDEVFSSDLLRAKRTAEIIMLERKITIKTTQAIRERHYGTFEGKSYDTYNHALKKLLKQYQNITKSERFKIVPPGVESRESAYIRFVTFLREIAVGFSGKNILVVTHGGVIRSFLIKIGFLGDQELMGSIKNGAFVKIESDGVDFFVKETKGINKISND